MPAPAQLKALILAGGTGTRLRPLTYAMAKQLVPVANKPILYYALDSLYEGGLREFGIIVSPETGQAIQKSVEEWAPADVNIEFILQLAPLGLAHAVKTAQPYLQDAPFIMYLGDNLINANLGIWIQEFLQSDLDASILLKEVPNPSSFGVAELDGQGQVVRLVEKPKEPKSNLALVGVYLFTPRIFEAIAAIKPSWRGELEITDAIQQLIEDKGQVKSLVHQGWWLDTGKKDDLLAANHAVLSDRLKPEILGDVDDASQITGIVRIGEGSKVINAKLTGPISIGDNCIIENTEIGPYSSIGDGSTVQDCNIANSILLGECELRGIHKPLRNSVLGKGCKIIWTQRDDMLQLLLADHSECQLT